MALFLCDRRVRPRPEPVQDSAPPWASDSRPLPGPDSSWTEPVRRRQTEAPLAKEKRNYEQTLDAVNGPKKDKPSGKRASGIPSRTLLGAMTRAQQRSTRRASE